MAYQINLTGQEIDERLQNIGTAEDVAAADGTLYARISKNADDTDELRDAVGHIDSAQTATDKTVTQHTADISALQTAVGNNKTEQDAIAQKVEKNAAAIAENKDKINTFDKKLSSGTLRDLYISAGAVYNETTGFYELNGLTDITEEEMRNIYMLYITNSPKAEHLVYWLTYPKNFRTNIAPRMLYVSNIQNSIAENSVLEVLVLSNYALYVQNSAATAHGSFPKLRRVVGYWVYANKNPSNYNFYYGQPFQNCPLLEEIRMKGINKSHTFAVSPNLSKESVLYMITNANPPSGAAAA